MDSDFSPKNSRTGITRRKFLQHSALIAGSTLIAPLSVRDSAYAAGSGRLKMVLIGSGSRGTGAAADALRADDGVELVAIADVFEEKVASSHSNLQRIAEVKDRVNVPDEQLFVGLDAYKKAISLADVVILATPPAFRPLHFEAAIEANKHVFMEKPLATDAPGIRRILASGELAVEKGLSVVTGFQYRYAVRFQKLIEQLHGGAIGDINSMSCNYLLAGIKQIPREEGDSEMEYQLRNWRFFDWLWGGSPAGLTVHFEDIAHWAKGTFPIRAFGTGGRAALSGPEAGDIFDHYYIEYEYDDGTRLHSRTRHIPGCWTNRSVSFVGNSGAVEVPAWGEIVIENTKGDLVWSHDDTNDPNPYLTEHERFFESIRSGNPMNDTNWAAKSSMASIMGRMAVHSGKIIEWDDAINSDLVLVPDNLSFDSEPPVLPKENGAYPVPVPGSGIRVL